MADRKYRMTRLRRGDYLLPSNDLTTLWRIYSYREEGSLTYTFGGTDGFYAYEKPVIGTFWATARRAMPPAGEPIDTDEILYGFEHWSGPHRTRQEALDEVLRD